MDSSGDSAFSLHSTSIGLFPVERIGEMKLRKARGLELVEARARAALLREGSKGSSTDRLLAESSLARAFIDSKLLSKEPGLLLSRWIEYRYLSPLGCTQRFTATYEAQVRKLTARYFDASSADATRPLMTEFAANSRQVMSQLWRARQAADELGMPYEMFIFSIMEQALIEQGHTKIPRPNQLYSKGVLPHAALYWAENRGTVRMFREDWDERFFAARFKADPAQTAALGLIEVGIRAKPDRMERALSNHLLGHFHPPTITVPEAVSRFGEELTTRALGRSPMASELADVPDVAARAPSCLGWLPEPVTNPCVSCPVLSACRLATGRVSARTVEQFGGVDPRNDRCRMLGRDRQTRFRTRKREALRLAAGDAK